MKTTRRVLSLVLAMIMLLSAFSVVASAREVDSAATAATPGQSSSYYLPGSFNGWATSGSSADNFLTTETDNVYSITKELAAGTYTFKVKSSSTWYGNNGTIEDTTVTTSSTGWSFTSSGGDCTLKASGGIYTFILDNRTSSNKKLIVEYDPGTGDDEPTDPEVEPTTPEATEPEETQPEETEPVEVETMTVYFQNNWMWTDVNAYFWGSATTNSAEWPGDVAKVYGNDGNYDIYAVTVPADIIGLIFNGQDGGTGSSNQTPDIKDAKDGNCYYMIWDEAAAKNNVGCEDISVMLPEPTQPEETEPEETEPEETEPEETEPEETEPEETEPEETEPEETEPEETEPEETEPEETEPEETEPEIIAEPGYYLVGTLNGADKWKVDADAADRMLKANEGAQGEYMLDYTFVEGDEIKVAYFDGQAITKWFNDGGDNYSIGAAKAGEATIYFRPEGTTDWSYYYFTVIPKVVPTEPEETQPEETEPEETEPEETQPEETQPEETEPEEVGTIKVYFQNNWLWSNVHAYFWGSATTNSAEWPGDAAQFYANDGEYDVYVAEVPADIKGIIFNGIKNDNSGAEDKTPDIEDFYDGACYSMIWNNKNDVVVNDIDKIVVPEETQPEETQPEETKPVEKVEKVTGLQATDVTRESFTLTWDAIEGAEKYWVYVNGIIYNKTTENTITLENRKVGTEYTVFVTAYVDGYITPADAAETITVTTLDYEYSYESNADAYSISLSWDAVDCTKAWVYIGTDADDLRIYNSSKTGELTIPNRESDTTYFVKITYLIDGVIVDNNEIFEVKTAVDEALVITANVVEDGIEVDWNALEGATKYWVTYETAEKTLVYSTTADSFVIPNGKADCTVSVKAAVNNKMVYFYSVDL